MLGVSRSGYKDWLGWPAAIREQRNTELLKLIRTVHTESRLSYGAPRVQAELTLGLGERTLTPRRRSSAGAGQEMEILRMWVCGPGVVHVERRIERDPDLGVDDRGRLDRAVAAEGDSPEPEGAPYATARSCVVRRVV
ncbi:hypothetical protein E1281_01050 [Actinomadura sp. KC345]|uniref:hypothetical protein n=1 Tax=Actinomadura sp. KC345 TaxID=2530371 RepID=UPI001045B158|nr:hypothetical protein [Actinomadura sp. KC345]TDC58570.1 hypothetical protein E1281_01050 [Actinomadura sp. KC345]